MISNLKVTAVRNSHVGHYLLLILVCFIWGGTPASGRTLVQQVSPMLITGARFLVAGIILFAWLYLIKDKKAFRPGIYNLKIMIIMAIMGICLHNTLLFKALSITTATNTALIESIGPTITTILAFFFIGERLSHKGWCGIIISCLGAVFIVAQGSLDTLLSLKFNYGDLLVVISESMWSAYVVVSWRLGRDISAVVLTAWTSIIGGLVCIIAGALSGGLYYQEIDSSSVISFLYLVFASGIFAFIAWNYAVTKVGATKAGAFVYLIPLAGAFIGITLLGEEVKLAQLLGGLVIILGMLITVRSKLTLKKEKPN